MKGRKRHLVTDTLGLVLAVVITTANVTDRGAADASVGAAIAKYPTIERLFVDAGYSGKCVQNLQRDYDIEAEVVRHPANAKVGKWYQGQMPLFEEVYQGFLPLPKRWVVERTNAWNSRPRRMARDYDRNLTVSEAWIWLTEARILLRRLETPAQRAA